MNSSKDDVRSKIIFQCLHCFGDLQHKRNNLVGANEYLTTGYRGKGQKQLIRLNDKVCIHVNLTSTLYCISRHGIILETKILEILYLEATSSL